MWPQTILMLQYSNLMGDRRGRDRMVVGFTTLMQSVSITTNVVSSYPDHGDVYSIQHYLITFVNDLWQVGGFLYTTLCDNVCQ